MSGFSHLDAGHDPRHWDALIAGLPALPVPAPPTRLIVVAAHPDDESLGAGGLIAAAASAGVEIAVVIVSDGEASHPRSPTHSPGRLAEIRRLEAQAAVAVLAPAATVHQPGLPDGDLAEHVALIAEQIASLTSAGDLVVSPWWGDGHRDHTACAQAAAIAAGRVGADHWQYPIWAWHWGAEFSDITGSMGTIPLASSAVLAKQRALSRYPSQHEPLSDAPGDEAILPPVVRAHFVRPTEVFVIESAAGPRYFERLYRSERDPWGLDDRFYEQRKRELLMAALPRPRFGRAFEPGCATGLLTAALADRCDELLAWDAAEDAVEQTRTRLAGRGQVRVERGAIPGDWPDGRFDLIVLSEVGYYCADLDALVARVDESLTADGVVVACHWRHDAPLHPHSADAVHAALGLGRHRVVAHEEADFRLDVWTTDGRSVAVRDGIVT